MKITFLGGADEVGASGILVETAGRRVLVDCGIRPSPKAHAGLAADQLPNLSQLESGSGKLDAVLVTHAHTDHTGALELVLERYPEVAVYATAPTLALTRVLHQDSRRIMQNRLDAEGELPLFDDVAVQRLMAAMVPVPFKTRLALADGLAATFFPAGHIAGAAMIGLESAEGRLLISGDISISPQRTVDGARPPAFHPDAFIVESTYGGKLHANRAVQERKLVETVAQVTAAGGKVLIPAFALGRAQEVLLILSEYQRHGELPAIPIWADGMVRAICQAYPSFGDALPLTLQEQGAQFFKGHIRPVASRDQRNAILWSTAPAVIVASSGMLAGGPSLSYARALASKPEHAILLTGYQDEESPGRRLQQLSERGSGTLRLGADKVDVQCRIATYSLSAHADESQIINLTETLDPEMVFLVHGDLNARLSLEKALSARQRSVHLPEAGQSFELQFEKTTRFISSEPSDNPRSRQVELNRQRGEQMSQFAGAAGRWVMVKGDGPTPARCLAVECDHLWVEIAPGLEQPVYPESVLAVLGITPPTHAELAPFAPPSVKPAVMEPNQALATANEQFPPEARLHKSGYRLADHILTLTFDFPDAACERYSDSITALEQLTGWQVEVAPETNQIALNALVREVLPEGCQIVKSPAIHRDQKRVAVTISRQTSEVAQPPESHDTAKVAARFHVISGWELTLIETARPPATAPTSIQPAGKRLEINAAYALIRSALEGSTLYRTSLKDDEIVLSFISRQVADRYQSKMDELARQTGWPLRANPQPNQGAILEVAHTLIARFGLAISKGPSIYPDKAEVSVTMAFAPSTDQQAEIMEAFERETGYRLIATLATVKKEQSPRLAASDVVEIPITRIRLSGHHQSMTPDPARLEKAIERARMLGITPPIQVRRTRDGYILSDGLYRLLAAESVGLERIPAMVE
jgi:Cft2 family RNA processing exonuclease